MKIRLAILDDDKNYLNRITSVFNNKYSDKIEVYSFTNEESAIQNLISAKTDVFLAGEGFDIDMNMLPTRCGFAYIVENAEVDSIRGQKTVAKFQRVDLFYKQILSLYAEHSSDAIGFKAGQDSDTQIVIFLPISGGVGSSTMAAAFSKAAVQRGKRVLYLNLEQFGTADIFFQGEGQFDFSDVIYTLKSKKNNLALKLEGSVKQDVSGVSFYSSPKVALDLQELDDEDLEKLLQEFVISGMYDDIVLDMDFYFGERILNIIRKADKIVFVSDGAEISIAKLERAYASFQVAEETRDMAILNKAYLMYNKFSNKSSKTLDGLELKLLGGAPKYEHASTRQIVEQLEKLTIWNELL